MSSRHFRKEVGDNSLPPPENDSDGDYEPLYTQHTIKSAYEGLLLSSNSESDGGALVHSEEEENDEAKAKAVASGAIKKKKKQKKKKRKSIQPIEPMDEIDRLVKEVNDLLGSPPPLPIGPIKSQNWAFSVLTVEPKHLNVSNEIRRIFGPEETEQNRRTRVCKNRALLLKRVLIHPNRDTAVYEFNKTGLSMSHINVFEDRLRFTYNHDPEYQKMHRQFLRTFAISQGTGLLAHYEDARRKMHVEALLEISDLMFRVEENSMGNEIVENVATYLQYVAHPMFMMTNSKVRLDYSILENRPFHVAMLKYMYLLSNKACHRTALEIAKMMLLLDPHDPLALVAVIDTFALRAREHEWLIEFIKYVDTNRAACWLHNIKWSFALAHFHVATKNKTDFSKADKHIQEALLKYPNVLVKILDAANQSNPKISAHKLFNIAPFGIGPPGIETLYSIYPKLTWPRWREPAVMEWLMKNATLVMERYDNDRSVKEEAIHSYVLRTAMFQTLPIEYMRHISVLSSMSKLVLESPLAPIQRPTCGWDPMFSEGQNRYNYQYHVEPPHTAAPGGMGLAFYRFFQSMIPTSNYPPDDDDDF